MTTYAIAITFMFGFVLGIIACAVILDYLYKEDVRKIEKARDDAMSMSKAVKVVEEKLGGTILNYEND